MIYLVVDWKLHKHFDFKKIQIFIFSPDLNENIVDLQDSKFLVISGPDIYAEKYKNTL